MVFETLKPHFVGQDMGESEGLGQGFGFGFESEPRPFHVQTANVFKPTFRRNRTQSVVVDRHEHYSHSNQFDSAHCSSSQWLWNPNQNQIVD